MRRFIEVVCELSLTALIYEGQPDEEEKAGLFDRLEEAWKTIQQEYSDAIGESDYKFYINQQRNVSMLLTKYKTLMAILEVMERFPFDLVEYWNEEELQAIKTEMGFHHAEVNKLVSQQFIFDISDEKKYRIELKKATSMGKNFKVIFDRKNQELKDIETKTGQTNKGEETVPVTRRYFQTMLIFLGDNINTVLDDSMTVFAFCERIRRYNAHQEYLSRQTHKK